MAEVGLFERCVVQDPWVVTADLSRNVKGKVWWVGGRDAGGSASIPPSLGELRGREGGREVKLRMS